MTVKRVGPFRKRWACAAAERAGADDVSAAGKHRPECRSLGDLLRLSVDPLSDGLISGTGNQRRRVAWDSPRARALAGGHSGRSATIARFKSQGSPRRSGCYLQPNSQDPSLPLRRYPEIVQLRCLAAGYSSAVAVEEMIPEAQEGDPK